MGWEYTDRLALSTPDKGECNWWYDWFRNTNIMEAVSAQDNSANFVVSGCAISAGTGLSANIAAGVVEVAGARYDITSGSLSLTDATTEREQFNLIYVDNTGSVKVYPVAAIPTGDFALLAVVDCASVAISRIGDLRRDSSEGDRTPVENDIINGDFGVWQRGISQSTTESGYYSCDRFKSVYGGSALRTITRLDRDSGDPTPYGCLTSISDSGGASTSVVAIQQKIKKVRQYGGKTICVSFDIIGPAGKYIAAEVVQSFDGVLDDVFVNGQKTLLTGSLQTVTFFFEVPVIGSGETIEDTASTKIGIFFSAGSSFDLRSNTLGNQTGDFYLYEVKTYISDKELPVRQRTPEDELQLCLQYFQKSYRSISPPGTISINGSTVEFGTRNSAIRLVGTRLSTTMRGLPTIKIYSTSSGAVDSAFASSSGDVSASSAVTSLSGFSYVVITSTNVSETVYYQWTAEAEL